MSIDCKPPPSSPSISIAPFSLSLSFALLYFRLNEHPSVNLALPPVGWHNTVEHPPQITTVCACEKTVVIVKQPGHFTSIKNERGAGTRVCRVVRCFSGCKMIGGKGQSNKRDLELW